MLTDEVPGFLFLYGSLRAGSGNPHAPILHSRCRLAGQGQMPGRLYRVNAHHYGAVHEPEAKETVKGDIIELPGDLRDGLLESLDRYQGVASGPGEPAPFRRQLVDVVCTGGRKYRCWAWIYAMPTSGCPQVRHGDAQTR